MAAACSLLKLRGLLVTQILLPLALAHSPHDAQIPLPNKEHKDAHKPKHNDSKHQHHAHNHDHEHDWTGCLPGPLLHPNHPTCELTQDQPSSEYPPWTHEPFCLAGSSPSKDSKNTNKNEPFLYCAFTNSQYPSPSKGVSIIANPDDPDTEKSLSNLATLFELLASEDSSIDDHAASENNKRKQPEILPYKIVPLEGKGMGLVATRKIKKGEVIMIDHAALIAETVFPTRVKRDVGRELLERAVRRLSSERREMVLGLAGSGTDLRGERRDSKEKGEYDGGLVAVDVEDVVRTNSFTVTVGGGSFMALFPRIARINHACKPSAFTRFNEKTLSNTVLAFRDISKGEEITISYSEFGLTHGERTPLLQRKWGFKCTCSLCSSSPSEIKASDTRRSKIKDLGPQVISQVQSSNFGLAVELNREMVELIHEEGLVPHRGEHWEVMARLLLAQANTLAAKGNKNGSGSKEREERKRLVKEARKYLRMAIKEMEEFGGGWGDDGGEEKIEELRGWLAKL